MACSNDDVHGTGGTSQADAVPGSDEEAALQELVALDAQLRQAAQRLGEFGGRRRFLTSTLGSEAFSGPGIRTVAGTMAVFRALHDDDRFRELHDDEQRRWVGREPVSFILPPGWSTSVSNMANEFLHVCGKEGEVRIAFEADNRDIVVYGRDVVLTQHACCIISNVSDREAVYTEQVYSSELRHGMVAPAEDLELV